MKEKLSIGAANLRFTTGANVQTDKPIYFEGLIFHIEINNNMNKEYAAQGFVP